MRRPYFAFMALGIVFMVLAASGRSNVYFGVAIVFFIVALIVALISKRRAEVKK